MTQKAISVRAPWWWFILHGGKDIENRDWPTNFRGTVYLHASKWWKQLDIEEDLNGIFDSLHGATRYPTMGDLHWMKVVGGGCIVGKVDVVDCISESDSPWFFGKYGFVLANPVALPEPIPCKGALGFFTVPDDVLEKEVSK